MKGFRLYAALVLCSAAVIATIIGGPLPFRVFAVGAFVVFVPGLLLAQMLAIGDQLLSLVITLATGPASWTLLATLATFAGLWAPEPTVVIAAVLLGVLALVLMPSALRLPEETLDDARHRFAAHLHDDLVLKPVGRHKDVFSALGDDD